MTTTSIVSTPAAQSYGLLRAAEAVTNWRALATCGIAALATFLVASLSAYLSMHSLVLGFLLGIVTLIVAMIGYSAVGITLMRQAQGQEIGFTDAFLQSAFSVHRFICVGFLLGLGYLAVVLGALVIFLLCKIPGLGSLLYAFAFPLVAIIIGTVGIGMGYVGFSLTAPAIWEGNDTFQTIARLLLIGRQRLMSVIINMVLLTILVSFLSLIVFGILGWGSLVATGLSTTVGVGPGSGLLGMVSMLAMPRSYGMGLGGAYGMAGQMAAFSFGVGLLFTIGLVIPFLTFINGTCLIYLQTSSGLDFSASEEKLRTRMDDAKRKANDASRRAAERMREAREAAQAAAEKKTQPAPAPVAAVASEPVVTAAPAPAPVVARSCASCKAVLAADDVFCGECGTKNPL
jgi:hypothetical protein